MEDPKAHTLGTGYLEPGHSPGATGALGARLAQIRPRSGVAPSHSVPCAAASSSKEQTPSRSQAWSVGANRLPSQLVQNLCNVVLPTSSAWRSPDLGFCPCLHSPALRRILFCLRKSGLRSTACHRSADLGCGALKPAVFHLFKVCLWEQGLRVPLVIKKF